MTPKSDEKIKLKTLHPSIWVCFNWDKVQLMKFDLHSVFCLSFLWRGVLDCYRIDFALIKRDVRLNTFLKHHPMHYPALPCTVFDCVLNLLQIQHSQVNCLHYFKLVNAKPRSEWKNCFYVQVFPCLVCECVCASVSPGNSTHHMQGNTWPQLNQYSLLQQQQVP